MPEEQPRSPADGDPVHVLFLCTGNICRSPLAEVIAGEAFGGTFGFSSAGTHAIEGTAASDHTRTMAAERGLDLSGHRARRLADCKQPDVIIGMEQHHLVAARRAFPDLDVSRIRLLDHPVGITDPYGHNIEVYRDAAIHIERALADLDLSAYTA